VKKLNSIDRHLEIITSELRALNDVEQGTPQKESVLDEIIRQ
jgi:hypothetical protein